MHQPIYREPGSQRLLLPWVRLHALKDYLDMPLMAAANPRVKTTFNLVPSLIDQIDLYLQGGTDPHLELTRISAQQLRRDQKQEILSTFFCAHIKNMIEPHERFAGLYYKAQDSPNQDILPDLFSSEEIRDLQVWSNLAWVDPMFRMEQPLAMLFDKGKQFTEEDKQLFLNWQTKHLARIVPTYQKLYAEGKIDVSFTPYFHPILPLLCDTDSAREAMPDAQLPKTRFAHPEDAEVHIKRSLTKFSELFGQPMVGMWPSEGSVSEQVGDIAQRLGLSWIASDEEVLFQSLHKSGISGARFGQFTVYQLPNGLKMFFRDHGLSDKIGFVYSGWEPERAVDDFIRSLLELRNRFETELDNVVVPVVLDGENAWEYYREDAKPFLELLYKRLNDEPLLRCVTMREAAQSIPAQPLPRLFAGSWISHNFRVWIGHHEDKRAWDLLSEARTAVVEAAASGIMAQEQIAKAWEQVYIAEGSDWCWWYGDEHRGQDNASFDLIYRRHLAAIYHAIGRGTPPHLNEPIYQSGSRVKLQLPEGHITPDIDGRITFFYEWAGSGQLTTGNTGGAMHRVDRHIESIRFGYDADFVYFCIDIIDAKALRTVPNLSFQFDLTGEANQTFDFPVLIAPIEQSGNRFAFVDVAEFAVRRSALWPSGHGQLKVVVSILSGQEKIDMCPGTEPLIFTVPELSREVFWPV